MGKTTLEKKNSFNYQKSEVEADKIADSFSGVSDVKKSMESRFGVDFSGVKLHTDMGAAKKADDIGAAAFAKGSDIYFGKGVYDQGSSLGRHVIAHELAHTMQQGTAGGEGAVSASAPAGEVQMLGMPNFLKKLFGGKKKEEAAPAYRRPPAPAPAPARDHYSRQEMTEGMIDGMRDKSMVGNRYSNSNLHITHSTNAKNVHEDALFATNTRGNNVGFKPIKDTVSKITAPIIDNMVNSRGYTNPENINYVQPGDALGMFKNPEVARITKSFQGDMLGEIEGILQSGELADVIAAQRDAFDQVKDTEVGQYYSNPYHRADYTFRDIALKGAYSKANGGVVRNPFMQNISGVSLSNVNNIMAQLAEEVDGAEAGSLTPGSLSQEKRDAIFAKATAAQKRKLTDNQMQRALQPEAAPYTGLEYGGDTTSPEDITRIYDMMITLGNQMITPTAGAAPAGAPTVAAAPAPTVAAAPAPTVAPAPVPTVAPAPVPTVAPAPVPTVAPAPAPAAAASAPAKQGFFSKLFGRKKKEETRSPDPVFTGSWTKQESEATRLQQQPLAAMRLQQQSPAATQSQQQSPEVLQRINDLRAQVGFANMSGKTDEVEALMQQIRALNA